MMHIAHSLAGKNTIINWFGLFGKESSNFCPDVLGYHIYTFSSTIKQQVKCLFRAIVLAPRALFGMNMVCI